MHEKPRSLIEMLPGAHGITVYYLFSNLSTYLLLAN